MVKCIVCNKVFVEGDRLQAFLRCAEDHEGSWTQAVEIGKDFHDKCATISVTFKRKHEHCKSTIKGRFDGHASPLQTLKEEAKWKN